MSPTFVRLAEVRLTVCLCVRLSAREHNGHARQKVELYCFVAHAQHNTNDRALEPGPWKG